MFKDSEKIRAAIFDVDGTLLNSTPMWNKLTFAFAEKMGIAAPDDLFRTLNSLSLEQCAAYYHDVLHVEGTVEEIHEGIIALAREGYAKEVPEITGAAAFLKALSERHIPAAVATASDIASLRPAFDRLDMSPYISVIESCTTIGKSKEHPDIYLKCAADLKAAPHETVVFEDKVCDDGDDAGGHRGYGLAGFTQSAGIALREAERYETDQHDEQVVLRFGKR